MWRRKQRKESERKGAIFSAAVPDEREQEAAIARVGCFVALLTEAAVRRRADGEPEVVGQARIARRLGKPIVVLLVDDVPVPPELEGAPVVHVGREAKALERAVADIAEERIVGVVLPPLE